MSVELADVWARYQADATEIPEHVTIRLCRSRLCSAPVWDGVTRAKGRPCAFDVRPDGTLTGTSHFRTCADVKSFGRRTA